jgi:uncharacterized protein (TIGR02145 family)
LENKKLIIMSSIKLLIVYLAISNFTFSQTVKIGSQIWCTKNLSITTFRNGESIPQAKTDEEWKSAGEKRQPAWCYYDNDPANGDDYGILYNWYAVNDSRGLAPEGYHIPSDSEWTTLTNFLGGESFAGKKIKSTEIIETRVSYKDEGGYYEQKYVPCSNCSYWTEIQKTNNPCSSCKNTRGKYVSTGKYIPKTKVKVEEKINIGMNGDNTSGFYALASGSRKVDGEFINIGHNCSWWSTTEDLEDNDWVKYRFVAYDQVILFHSLSEKPRGLSIRCVKD